MRLQSLLSAALLLACARVLAAGAPAVSDDIRIITDPTLPPMEFVESGQRKGFDIDLGEALAKEIGRKLDWTDSDFKGLIPAVVSGRADAAMSSIYITDERRRQVDFTDPYYTGGLVVLTKEDSGIKTIQDLDGKNVSVQMGTDSTRYLHETYPKIHLIEAEKGDVMLNLVNMGRADAAVTGLPAASLYARNHPNFVVLEKRITNQQYGIAVSKKRPQLLAELNVALKRIKENGTYQKIVDKWFKGPAR